MRYPAHVVREGRREGAEFPDCPGCQTCTDPGEDIEAHAAEALQGWLESMLDAGDVVRPPQAGPVPVPGGRIVWVPVPAALALRLARRWGNTT